MLLIPESFSCSVHSIINFSIKFVNIFFFFPCDVVIYFFFFLIR